MKATSTQSQPQLAPLELHQTSSEASSSASNVFDGENSNLEIQTEQLRTLKRGKMELVQLVDSTFDALKSGQLESSRSCDLLARSILEKSKIISKDKMTSSFRQLLDCHKKNIEFAQKIKGIKLRNDDVNLVYKSVMLDLLQDQNESVDDQTEADSNMHTQLFNENNNLKEWLFADIQVEGTAKAAKIYKDVSEKQKPSLDDQISQLEESVMGKASGDNSPAGAFEGLQDLRDQMYKSLKIEEETAKKEKKVRTTNAVNKSLNWLTSEFHLTEKLVETTKMIALSNSSLVAYTTLLLQTTVLTKKEPNFDNCEKYWYGFSDLLESLNRNITAMNSELKYQIKDPSTSALPDDDFIDLLNFSMKVIKLQCAIQGQLFRANSVSETLMASNTTAKVTGNILKMRTQVEIIPLISKFQSIVNRFLKATEWKDR